MITKKTQIINNESIIEKLEKNEQANLMFVQITKDAFKYFD